MAILLFRSMNANLPTSNDDYFGLRKSEHPYDSGYLAK